MFLPDFATEQWMNDHENDAVYNMTDTCIQPLQYSQLLEMDEENALEQITLDYGHITGDPKLIHLILDLYQTGDIDEITLAQGCLQANEMVMETLLEKGDRVIAFTPGYQQFIDYPKSIGCEVIEIPLLEERGWQPDITLLNKAFKKHVKMVIINNPSNPTGTRLTEGRLQKLIRLCEKENTWILSDEVYNGLSIRDYSISDLYAYGISTGSLSKIYSCAGLRLGWIKANKKLIRMINVRRDYSIISTGPLVDTCAKIILDHQKQLLKRSQLIVKKNKKILRDFLQNEPSFSCVIPDSGTVCFLKYEGNISSKEFALKLLKEHGVFYVPGSCFDCENHLRLGLTREAKMFKEGLEITAKTLKEINASL